MKNLYKALAEFQQEVPVIHKGTQGYGYTYADLTKIIQIINPLLAKHGLGYSQPLDGNAIKTIIFHIETGETITSTVNIPQGVSLAKMNDFQVLGSAISYLRRYSLASILTLVTDVDLDASGTQTTEKSVSKQPEKIKLTSNQMIQLIGAIKSEKTTENGELIDVKWALQKYDLSKSQIESIKNIQNEA